MSGTMLTMPWLTGNHSDTKMPKDLIIAPWCPSNAELLGELDLGTPKQVIDLGSGDGSVLHWFYQKFGCECVGYELDPQMVALSNQKFPQLDIRKQDLWEADLSKTDVVFLYWMPYLMEGFRRVFWDKLKKGAIVISNEFEIPGLQGAEHQGLYVYKK